MKVNDFDLIRNYKNCWNMNVYEFKYPSSEVVFILRDKSGNATKRYDIHTGQVLDFVEYENLSGVCEFFRLAKLFSVSYARTL